MARQPPRSGCRHPSRTVTRPPRREPALAPLRQGVPDERAARAGSGCCLTPDRWWSVLRPPTPRRSKALFMAIPRIRSRRHRRLGEARAGQTCGAAGQRSWLRRRGHCTPKHQVQATSRPAPLGDRVNDSLAVRLPPPHRPLRTLRPSGHRLPHPASAIGDRRP